MRKVNLQYFCTSDVMGEKKCKSTLQVIISCVWNVTFIHDVFSHICIKEIMFCTGLKKVDLCIFSLISLMKKRPQINFSCQNFSVLIFLKHLFFHLGIPSTQRANKEFPKYFTLCVVTVFQFRVIIGSFYFFLRKTWHINIRKGLLVYWKKE